MAGGKARELDERLRANEMLVTDLCHALGEVRLLLDKQTSNNSSTEAITVASNALQKARKG